MMVFENCVYYSGPERKGPKGTSHQTDKSGRLLMYSAAFLSPSVPLASLPPSAEEEETAAHARCARLIALSRIFLKNLSREPCRERDNIQGY